MRPTPRAVLLFALSVPLALFIVTGMEDYWSFALYFPCIVLAVILVDMSMALPNRQLHAAVKLPVRLYVGENGNVHVIITAKGWQKPVFVQALLELTGEAQEPEEYTALLQNGEVSFPVPLVPTRRGKISIDALWLRWYSPLGLIEIRRRQPIEKSIAVTPDVQGIHETALHFFARDAAYGIKTQILRGEGTEFDTLCEYSQGMDSRFIDWKRSARHRKLLCKEFRQERNHQIILGFDTGHLMLEPVNGIPRLDHAIKAGLLLGWISLYTGDIVGGCGFDARFRNFIKPSRGMQYFTQLQQFAAGLEYQTEETNFTLGLAELNTRLQRRALVVLFTDFVDTISAELLLESLQIMVRKHVVIFVTMRDPTLTRLRNAKPDSFQATAEAVVADDFLRERSIVLERINRLGVHCLESPAQGVSTALLNRYLLIKQRGLL